MFRTVVHITLVFLNDCGKLREEWKEMTTYAMRLFSWKSNRGGADSIGNLSPSLSPAGWLPSQALRSTYKYETNFTFVPDQM